MPLKEDGEANCYISVSVLDRLDMEALPYLKTNAKRIIVADTGDSPSLITEPPTVIEFHTMEPFVLPISNYTDPEGNKV